jgi:hypothetical protein
MARIRVIFTSVRQASRRSGHGETHSPLGGWRPRPKGGPHCYLWAISFFLQTVDIHLARKGGAGDGNKGAVTSTDKARENYVP